MIRVLRIGIDGHFHGSPVVPKPWVARVAGPCPRYGLAREFVEANMDWRESRRAWSGNLYGRVCTFPLRTDNLYEVSRLRGRSSKRYIAREFVWCSSEKFEPQTVEDVLAFVNGDSLPATFLRIDDDRDDRPWVAEVTGLGTPRHLGWVVVDGVRLYRLREGGVFEVRRPAEAPKLVTVEHGRVTTLRAAEAWARVSA